jgi:hypothetical protein
MPSTVDVGNGALPCVRPDPDVAAERILQLEQQYHGGDDDRDDSGRHHRLDFGLVTLA